MLEVPRATHDSCQSQKVKGFLVWGPGEAKNLVGVALKDGQGKKLGVNCKLVGSVAKILPLVVWMVGWDNVILN